MLLLLLLCVAPTLPPPVGGYVKFDIYWGSPGVGLGRQSPYSILR